jgi:MFS family permease
VTILFGHLSRPLHADFWRLWYAGLVISTVRWLETVVVGVVVYQQTNSAFVVAAITMLRLLPMALFGAFLGAFAETLDRRFTLAGMFGLMAITSAVLSIIAWTSTLQVWHLAVASFISGCGWATDNPLRRMVMGDVVGRDRMATAMALDVSAGNAARMVGPTLGGVLLAGIGSRRGLPAVRCDVRNGHRRHDPGAPPHCPASRDGAVLARTWEAVAIVFHDTRLRATMVVTIIYNVFAWPFTSMIPVIGRDRLHLGPEGVGFLTSLDGVGAFAGALLLARWLTPRWHARAYVGGVAVYLVALVVFAFATDFAPAGAALLLTGISGAAFATLQATIVYLAAPADMRSRILGVLSVCIGTGPIGFLWLGWLADRIGAPDAMAITGGAGLLALAATYPMWRKI